MKFAFSKSGTSGYTTDNIEDYIESNPDYNPFKYVKQSDGT
jgi:hypothetical protein